MLPCVDSKIEWRKKVLIGLGGLGVYLGFFLLVVNFSSLFCFSCVCLCCAESKRFKAVVLRIDSPGGDALASDL